MAEEQESYTLGDLQRLGGLWLDRIEAAEKVEKNWLDAAKDAEAAYLVDVDGESMGDVPRFNILHSNIQTIVPAVYNSTPAPDIRPRHDNLDDEAKQFSDVLERAIATQIDDDRLDVEMEGVAQDMTLAGRGVIRLRFDADFWDDGSVTNERVTYEAVSWKNYREGPATRWQNVPWVAFRHQISEEQLERITNEEIAEKYPADDDSRDDALDYAVWEIWCKETKKVYFVVEDTAKVVAIQEDPLGLDKFFPMPAPAQGIFSTSSRTPVCPYSIYKEIAKEVDTATKRINRIMSGLKVRGAIAADASIVELISNVDDNELAPLEDMQGIIAQGGLDKAIMWWPVEQAIAVLRELYQQRQASIQSIYEITGLSDILRGASDPRETAAAQDIKAEWGSIRVKRLQRIIQRTARDLFVLTAEIMSRQFTPQGLARAAGVELTPGIVQMMGALDHYRIDVESDSTIRSNLTSRRKEMAEFLMASTQFFQAMAPILQQSPDMAGPTGEIYGAFTRTFQLGKTAEDAIEQMVMKAREQAQNPQPNPAQQMQQQQAQLQMAKVQADVQKAQADAMEAQARAQAAQAQAQVSVQKQQVEAVKARFDIALKSKELGMRVDEQELAERKAEVDTLLRMAELEMEDDQRRPVRIGG